MTEKHTMKRCDRCDYRLTLETDTWRRMETANSKPFKLKHKLKRGECGGEFVSLVSRIGRD